MQNRGSFFRHLPLLVALLSPLLAPPAQARHGEQAQREQAEKLRAAGIAALTEHRLEAARTALDDSYERLPASETFYYMGQLALAENRPIEAQDLMRRFSHEVGASADAEQQKEAARIMQIPLQPYGELEVLGARGALVRVDNRLLGVLPLSQPMLLASGTHSVQLKLGSKRLESPVEVRSGRTAQLRFDLQTGLAVITLPPTVLLVQDYGSTPPALQDILARAAEQAVRAEEHAILHPRPALVRAPELTSCVRTRGCQVQLMQRNEVDYALALTLQPVLPAEGAAPVSATLRGELLEAAMGEDAVMTVEQPVELNALRVPEQAAALTAGMVTRLLREGRARPRGTLAVQSNPPGASVILPRVAAGVTPCERTVWAGPLEVTLKKTGYQPARVTVNIEAGKKESVQVNLEPLPGPPPPRPLWRTVTGSVGIGVGGLLALGCWSPATSGGDSGAVAAGVTGIVIGSGLVIGGVLLLVLPWDKTKGKPRPAPSPPPVQDPPPAPASSSPAQEAPAPRKG